MFQSLRWRIAVPYLILILLAMGGLTVYLSYLVRESHLSDLQEKLIAEARLIGDAVKTASEWDRAEGQFDALSQHYADLLDARVTFIGADGTVLGESHADRVQMDNHLRRPEVQEALRTGQGNTMRLSRRDAA